MIAHPLFHWIGVTGGENVGAGGAAAVLLVYIAMGVVALADRPPRTARLGLAYVLFALHLAVRPVRRGRTQRCAHLAGDRLGAAVPVGLLDPDPPRGGGQLPATCKAAAGDRAGCRRPDASVEALSICGAMPPIGAEWRIWICRQDWKRSIGSSRRAPLTRSRDPYIVFTELSVLGQVFEWQRHGRLRRHRAERPDQPCSGSVTCSTSSLW